MSNALKSHVYYGSCMDTIWPSGALSSLNNTPPIGAYNDALNQQVVGYAQVLTGGSDSSDGPNNIKNTIASGYPVLSAIKIYGNSIYTAGNGIVITPQTTSADTSTGHAVLFVGYNEEGYTIKETTYPKAKYKFKNSWNTTWGDGGYGYLDEDYITNGLVYESWVIFQQDILRDDVNISINTIPDLWVGTVAKQIDDVFEQIRRLADFSKQLQVKNMLERLKIKYNQNEKLSNFIDDIRLTVVNSLA